MVINLEQRKIKLNWFEINIHIHVLPNSGDEHLRVLLSPCNVNTLNIRREVTIILKGIHHLGNIVLIIIPVTPTSQFLHSEEYKCKICSYFSQVAATL